MIYVYIFTAFIHVIHRVIHSECEYCPYTTRLLSHFPRR